MALTHALTFLKALWSVDTTLYNSNMELLLTEISLTTLIWFKWLSAGAANKSAK